ncbi:mediator of RNA polymerase II transcription subunit 15 [Octopus vulgaris]|uniref:Mediator of RNA polymerase II transcription subunit 15 n=1 Tax=Octopus vulgaris TaxID=6645 RepID=A0AA36AQK3_OCTVU|nr:mediator of RNA polymerase II transcription subunit 15 [Octopus vulgaris]
MSDMQNEWKTTEFRNRVVMQIENALKQSGTKIPKSSVEMENHLHQKAKTKEEYLDLLSKLIIHVSEISKKGKQAASDAVNQGIPPQGIPPQSLAPGQSPQQAQQQSQTMQDPINALQNLAMQGTTSAICPQQAGMMNHQQATAAHIQFQQRHMPARTPVNQPKPVPLQRHDAFMVSQAPPQAQQQTQPPPTSQPPVPPPQTSTQQQPQQQQSAPQQQMVGQQMAVSGPNQLPFQGGNPPSVPRSMVQSPYMSPQQYGQSPSQVQPASNVSQLNTAHSPATQSSHMVHSPANLAAPSPNTHIVPSPVSRNAAMGAPSPGSALNTPGNPGSVGTTASPSEDQAYLEKLKQLSKYIDPLRRMIRKTETEEDNKKDQSHKMKNLLEILSDPSKRLPMTTLLKCEQVLVKMELSKPPSSSDGSGSSSKNGEQHMCQPLLDSIAAHMKSPMLNHTLHRTFGPAVAALRGQPIRVPSPPPTKKPKVSNEKDKLTNILQGEIARLPHRFRINLDPAHHVSSKTVHLICKLDDKNLPSVPPILIVVPEDYPSTSPQCDSNAEDYTATPFLQGVQNALQSSLQKMPDHFSVTTLLDTWEMSVRRMCAPTS